MDRSVRIKKVGIDRALGIRHGSGFELEDLSPAINIIFGPNGCGKSTTCTVVQELLWPGKLERPTVSGVVLDGSDEWRIEIDAGHVEAYHDGLAGSLPEFGPSEGRNRYHLGLRDLIVDDDGEDFAKKIADASQGGYDLEDAASKLGFRDRPKSRRKEHLTVQECKGRVERARQIQREIQDEADRLKELTAQLEAAQEADRELAVLQDVKAYFEVLDRCEELAADLSVYPDGVARLQGNEKELLEELKADEDRLNEQRRSAEDRISEAEAVQQEANLPEGAVDSELIRNLRAWKNEWRKLEARIENQERRRDEARGEAEKARTLLGSSLTDEQLGALETLENDGVSAFARKADRVRAARTAYQKQRDWLEKDAPEEVQSVSQDDLRAGIDTLSKWLAAEQASDGSRGHVWAMIIAALVIAGLAIILSIVSANWFWALAIVAAIVLVVLDWHLAKKGDAADNARSVHRDSYTALPLPKPSDWQRHEIVRLLRHLGSLLGTHALADERRRLLDALSGQAKDLSVDEQELEAERKELETQLGISIELGDEWLPVLVGRIDDWQSAVTRQQGAESALRELQKDAEELRTRISEALSPFGYSTASTSDEAEENISDLDARSSKYRTAAAEAKNARESIEQTIEPGLDRVRASREKVFNRLEIAPAQAAVVDDWFARRPDYLKCKESLDKQQAILENKKTALHGKDDLLEIDRTDLEHRIAERTKQSERRDELNESIGAINQRIEAAKSGHELTDALEVHDEAIANLEAARDENGRAVAGAALTDWVRREAVERSRPRVFQRANELFVRFTRGSLRLEMDDRSSPPSFVARAGDRPAQSLNELSDGERIQLMAAVRLAFLEQDESRPLPLLVDEVLGTSDDGRSGVMIDTMIEIAREGRQVFYCTAQHDEVGKWKARLESEQIDHKLFDLAQARGLSAAQAVPLEIAAIEKSIPPQPNGRSYEEYGRALGVPGVDPLRGTVDHVHLWHLLDDASVLHELLCKDISTWGQLRTLLAHGGAGLLGEMDGTPARAYAAAKAIERACEALRIGRGRPVDRETLMNSGFVSDTFIDELTALCYELGGDAKALLDALDDGKVSRFWRKNIDGLREYFEDNGHLPLREPLARKDLRVQVLGAVSEEIRKGVLDVAFVDRLLASLGSANRENS